MPDPLRESIRRSVEANPPALMRMFEVCSGSCAPIGDWEVDGSHGRLFLGDLDVNSRAVDAIDLMDGWMDIVSLSFLFVMV